MEGGGEELSTNFGRRTAPRSYMLVKSDFSSSATTFHVFQNASTYLTELRKRNGQALARTSYAFDSIWAAALMLNETSNETRPENLELGSDKFSNEYEKLLKEQEFEGLSVRFFYFGDKVTIF